MPAPAERIAVQNRRLGPHIVAGKLFFKLLDGSVITCNCIADPYASMIVETWAAEIDRNQDRG